MGLVERNQLVARVSPPFDHLLATQLVDEFVSQERRYIQRDWSRRNSTGASPAVLARILYHQDSGNLSPGKEFDDCASYIENEQVRHAISPRRTALHLVKVLRTVYKFRSQRGAVHISPTYGANHMDARLMIEGVRWAMNETLRVFWNGDRQGVAKAVRELLQFDVPCIGVFEDVVLVQRTDPTPDAEVLVLRHYAGEAGFTRTELGHHVKRSPPRVTEALRRLAAGQNSRQVVLLSSGRYRLTELGSRRIREHLADKLLLQ